MVRMLLPAAIKQASAISANLKNWWKFQTDYVDSVGGKNGTGTAGLTFETKLGRKAVKLPGSINNWIDLPSLTIGAGPWTVSTWYCPETLAGYQHLLSSSDNTEFLFKISPTSDPTPTRTYLYAKTMAPAGSKFANVNISVNVWHLITITYDAGTLKFYINGVLRGTYSVTMNIAAKTFRIGNGVGTGEYSRGWQADLRIYDKALSLEEVQDLYTNS
ncbi:putative concanavalin A-like lectin/glucanases superfamily protein [Pseudomonas phage pPa_SNUABM_DT01]|nr:putative concanavalin A-like lectin/glucanases superfamily protein [Pseudomonas phage pPa_SNUABM_DT01]